MSRDSNTGFISTLPSFSLRGMTTEIFFGLPKHEDHKLGFQFGVEPERTHDKWFPCAKDLREGPVVLGG